MQKPEFITAGQLPGAKERVAGLDDF